ncbi:MAG TPA: hypothetical protein VHO49_03890, partial [Anaerolineales bacterium]|nr:hypothetical protein [Anaerolineales bacterium]
SGCRAECSGRVKVLYKESKRARSVSFLGNQRFTIQFQQLPLDFLEHLFYSMSIVIRFQIE